MFGKTCLDFVPSVVMLILGMLAIHYTVKLIQVNHVSYTDYHRKSVDIITLRRSYDYYYVLLRDYREKSLQSEENDVLISALTGSFVDFSDLYGDLLIRQYNKHHQALSDDIFGLQSKIEDIQEKLIYLSSDGLFENPEVLFIRSDELRKAIYGIESRFLLDPSKQDQFFDDINQPESILYWVVTAMGLCGFVLVLLNGDKLRRLRDYNDERQETLGVLENRLAAMEAACEGIMIVDGEGNLNYMNEAMCDICLIDNRFDYIDEEWTDIFSENDLDFIATDILSGLEENGYWIGDFPMERDDGTVIQTEFSLARLPEGGLIGTAQDMTQRVRMEQEKRDLEDQFYQAQKMEAIGRLAGGIAHDFNNILAAINGFAEFLVEDLKKGSDEKKYASNILQASHQAKDLVEQMLTFSRRRDSAKENVDLAHVLMEVKNMIEASVPKTLEIHAEIGDHPVYAMGSTTQVSQMVMNLCVNARDALGEERGTLKIILDECVIDDGFSYLPAITEDMPHPKDQPMLRIDDIGPASTRLILGSVQNGRKYARIAVEDTGEGMSRVIMEQMFEPFFTTKDVDKGTGLGLATVHGVVIGHSGALVIESTLMKGSAFEIFLPLSEDVSNIKPIGKKGCDGGAFNPADYEVLLVEDNETVRDVMKNMIERMGYHVKTCIDGLEALHVLKEDLCGFDMVLSDYNMPKMTGLELIENISIDNPDLPFVILSGYSEEEMYAKIQNHASIKAVLKKPVHKDILEQKLKDIIEDVNFEKAKSGTFAMA